MYYSRKSLASSVEVASLVAKASLKLGELLLARLSDLTSSLHELGKIALAQAFLAKTPAEV
jgi:hypothetical protein